MKDLVIATRNPGKVKEIRELLAGVGLRLLSLQDFAEVPEVVEDGLTLEENALKKAREAYLATGIPALSDDSGLEVFALGMQPGVRSARYAGEHVTYADNNRKLLEELGKIGAADRSAQFRCVAAFVDATVQHIAAGTCRGRIGTRLRGGGGFGYDPLFIPDGHDQTFAELPPEVKNGISHRAAALSAMKVFLNSHFRSIR